MTAAARLTGWVHVPCFAHTLNLIVQEATDRDQGLTDVRTKARSIVTYFKQSVIAKDKLGEIQLQMGQVEKKLIRDVVTRWNSSYLMYERLVEIYREVNTALCFMDRNDLCLSAAEIDTMSDAMVLLKPFEEVTRELSADKFVSISKVIPLARSLQRITAASSSSYSLKHELLSSMTRRFTNMEANYPLAASTLLDPRFKKLGFGDPSTCTQACDRLLNDLVATISAESNASSSAAANSSSSESVLWSLIDQRVSASQSRPSTSSSMITFGAYLDETNLARMDDSLRWWQVKEQSLSHLSKLAKKYLSIPATSVPSERLFSKAGELTSMKRNRIKSRNVDMILFLNKGQ